MNQKLKWKVYDLTSKKKVSRHSNINLAKKIKDEYQLQHSTHHVVVVLICQNKDIPHYPRRIPALEDI